MCDQDPLSVTMVTVTTASPTVKTVKKSFVPKRGRIPAKEKLALQTKSSSLKSSSMKNCNTKVVSGQALVAKKFSKMSKPKYKGKAGHNSKCSNTQDDGNEHGASKHLSDMVLDKKLTITPSLIENLDGFCAVADIISGENDELSKEDDSDDDIHVDIENDDDSDSNPILIGRSTSPNSVYEKLLIEANLNENSKTNSDEISDKCNYTDKPVKTFLEWKTCESQKELKEGQQMNETVDDRVNASKNIEETEESTLEPISNCDGCETNNIVTEVTNEDKLGKLKDRNLLKKDEIVRQTEAQKVLGM